MVSSDELAVSRAELAHQWRLHKYWADIGLLEFIEQGVHRYPDVESIFMKKGSAETLTNAERYRQGCEIASSMREIGVCKGDVVAVQLPGWAETAVIYQAIIQLGAVTLPIVNIYGELEVEYILRQSGAKVLFMPDSITSTDYSARYKKYRTIESLERVIIVGDDVPEGCIGWSAFRQSAATKPYVRHPDSIDPDDVCLIVYTSGTTSKPKGVKHTHNTLLAEWTQPSFNIIGPHLCCFPMGHYTGYSFIMRPMFSDVKSIFMDRWDPDIACGIIERYRVKECGGTPFFLQTLLDSASSSGADISSLEWFPMGGTGITPDHIRTAEKNGFLSGRVYGSTEHPTVTFSWPDMPFSGRAGTDGRIDPGNRVRIVNGEGVDLPLGEEGEILTLGPELFVGYVEAGLDLEAFLPGGWFRTGDVGRVDASGCLTLTGRIKDIIIRGGENISALEVEEHLQSHPNVRESAAVGFPHRTYGEKVCAFVTLVDDTSITLDEIHRHFIALGVAKQKIPEKLVILADFPRTPSGKIQKFQLRKNLTTED
jgi:acyl-coenzyme A synthetase/AMP-(fatty) acid ligase